MYTHTQIKSNKKERKNSERGENLKETTIIVFLDITKNIFLKKDTEPVK